MAKKTTSESKKNYFKTYNYDKNRRIKLERLLAKQPENKQIQKALDNIHYRRKTPKTVNGWVFSQKNSSIFENISGKEDAMSRAFVQSIIAKTNRELKHKAEFGSKNKSSNVAIKRN